MAWVFCWVYRKFLNSTIIEIISTQQAYKTVFSTEEDLEKIAICHAKAFPASLSSKMGIKYLKSMFGWYLSNERTFLIHITKDEHVLGYCGGLIVDGTLETGSTSGMLQYSFYQAVRSILLRPWLIIHPEMVSRYKLIARNIFFRIKKSVFRNSLAKTDKKTFSPYAGLVVIGVDPQKRGGGIGSLLLNKFEEESTKLGVEELRLTVNKRNVSAIRFYERNGWSTGENHPKTIQMLKKII